MIKTYKYKLKLSKAQSNLINSWIGASRFVFNLAKETKLNAYRSGVYLSKFDLMKQLIELKEVEWIKSVPSQTLQNVIERLDFAYQSYFRKLKNGEITKAKKEYIAKRILKGLSINENKLADFGKPKWAKKDEYNSILFKSVIQIKNGFSLPKIGNVSVFKDRMPDGELKTATIIKENSAFFICITFECESKNLYPVSENQVVGLDMGISYFLVDSNGCFVENPRHTKKYEDRLRVKNRSLARKTKDSAGLKKTKKELNKLHHKVAEVRKDFLHKVSFQYVKENSIVVCEDLKVKNMIKFGNLSKHIADVSWSKFFSMLDYKSEYFEKEFIQINPKYTSQKCSECGHISAENRITQARFECVKCGHKQNADFNAAINILGEGIAFKRQREVLACA
jgi:putative transposase